MTDTYCIQAVDAPDAPSRPISSKEFRELDCASSVLKHALALEENYEIIIANYLELENTVNQIAAEEIVRQLDGYRAYFDIRLRLNLRLINLLTAVRLYFDSLHRNMKGCSPRNQELKALIDSARKEEHRRNANYRFMEALRNHAQHRGGPVHWLQFSDERVEQGPDHSIESRVVFVSTRLTLEDDESFNKEVLGEIGHSVFLKKSTRDYLQCINRVHSTMRKISDQSIEHARQVLEEAQIKGRGTNVDRITSLSACHKVDGELRRQVPLTLYDDDIRRDLRRKNPDLLDLQKRFITGR